MWSMNVQDLGLGLKVTRGGCVAFWGQFILNGGEVLCFLCGLGCLGLRKFMVWMMNVGNT